MKRTIIKLSLLLALLMPSGTTIAADAQKAADAKKLLAALSDVRALDEKLNYSLVYLDRDVRRSIVELEQLLPDYNWSAKFKALCADIEDASNVAHCDDVKAIINECLEACKNLPCDIQGCLEKYKQTLHAGNAHISALDMANDDTDESAGTRGGKCSKFCKISVRCLSVNGALNLTGNLVVNGVTFSDLPDLAAALVAAGVPGLTGPTGATGAAGATGATGSAGGLAGAAEFIRTIQSPNNSVPPGTAFTIDTQVFNSNPSAIVASAGAGGTVYTLTAGTYMFDYEMSLEAAGSVGIYTGPSAGSLALDTNTVAGSTTGTTWIHGRAIVQVTTTLVAAISSVVGTAAVTTAGTDAGSFMIRLTILKLS